MLGELASGFAALLDPVVIGFAFSGLVGGIAVGSLPGLTATMAVAVLAPFTFTMDAIVGFPRGGEDRLMAPRHPRVPSSVVGRPVAPHLGSRTAPTETLSHQLPNAPGLCDACGNGPELLQRTHTQEGD